MAESRLQLVGQEQDSTPENPFPVDKPSRVNKIAGDVVLLALTELSKRFVVALGNLFTLLTVASAFWLWYVTPSPDAFQLAKLAMYGAFVLGANWIVRRR